MKVIAKRTFGDAVARLVVDAKHDRVHILIEEPGAQRNWVGYATFPSSMAFEAKHRFDQLQNDIDVEDLLREWGDPSGRTVQEFIGFIGAELW